MHSAQIFGANNFVMTIFVGIGIDFSPNKALAAEGSLLRFEGALFDF